MHEAYDIVTGEVLAKSGNPIGIRKIRDDGWIPQPGGKFTDVDSDRSVALEVFGDELFYRFFHGNRWTCNHIPLEELIDCQPGWIDDSPGDGQDSHD